MDSSDLKKIVKDLQKLAKQLDDIDSEMYGYENIMENARDAVKFIFMDRHSNSNTDIKASKRTAVRSGIFFIRLTRPILSPMVDHRKSIHSLFQATICNYLTYCFSIKYADTPFKLASDSIVTNLIKILDTEIYYLKSLCNLDGLLDMFLELRYASYLSASGVEIGQDAQLKGFAQREGMHVRSVKARLKRVLNNEAQV
ncbi:hypothetical protein JFN90_22010 [Geomonas sp. Red259]|uniref:Sigma-70 family RNA polymerase sigma factor n=2 Tax=Geomonas propionica TaxID=2798582 RepID=A0ABS0YXZ2_9BACT|nr:hypothetical protein [Geomonas propionica]